MQEMRAYRNDWGGWFTRPKGPDPLYVSNPYLINIDPV